MLKIFLIVGGILAVLVIGGAVLLVSLAPEGLKMSFGSKPQGTEVRMEPAERRALVETVTAPGEIEPLTKVEISAEVSARIELLPFREGETVRRDDVIVKLDDRDLKAALKSAQALRDSEQFRLQSEQARLSGLFQHQVFARRTLERQQALYDSGDVSRSTLDDAMEAVEDLDASIEASTHLISVIESTMAAAEGDIERAQQALLKTVIRSPMDGLITQLNAEIGEVVLLGTMNNPGTVIMTIADLSRMILNAKVAETDIAKVAVGQKSRIHINAYPDDVFSGVVRQIALQRTLAKDGTGHFETEIEIELQGRRIYSGLVANVDVEIAEHDGIVIPSQAVVERLVEDLPPDIRRSHPLVNRNKKTTDVAFRIVDGKTVCTPVKRGASDLTHTLVLEGLNEGEIVIVGPYKVLESIKHDEAVRDEEAARKEAAPAPAGDSETAADTT